MPRHEIDVTITDEGRDKGKIFHIREMNAVPLEYWSLSVLSLLARSGVDIGALPGANSGGTHTLAAVGISKLLEGVLKVDMVEAYPLLRELMDCVTLQPDPKNPAIVRRLDPDEDIEEVATLLKLKWEAYQLNTNFSSSANPSTSKISETATYIPESPTTETSPRQSPQFSQSARTKRPR